MGLYTYSHLKTDFINVIQTIFWKVFLVTHTHIYENVQKGNKCLQQNNNMQIIYFYMCVSHQQTTKEGNQRWSRYYTRKKLLLHVFSMLSQCYIGIGLGQQVRHIIMTFYLSQFVCVCGVWGIDYHICFFLDFLHRNVILLEFYFFHLKVSYTKNHKILSYEYFNISKSMKKITFIGLASFE